MGRVATCIRRSRIFGAYNLLFFHPEKVDWVGFMHPGDFIHGTGCCWQCYNRHHSVSLAHRFFIVLSFALAALKRLIELVDVEARNETSAKGRGYVIGDLAVLLPTTLTSGYLSVLVLTLYVLSDQVKPLYSQPAALWGVCVVLFY